MKKKSAGRESAASKVDHSEPKASRPFAPGYGIAGADDPKGMLPWSWVGKKMAASHTFWLATVHDYDGRPHVMPIWGVWMDDGFYFSTGRNSRKGQNLAANPACTVTNDDGEEAVIVEGKASEVKDEGLLERVAGVYKKKYKMDPRGMKEPIFALKPKTVFGFMEKTFPKTATKWKVG